VELFKNPIPEVFIRKEGGVICQTRGSGERRFRGGADSLKVTVGGGW